MRNKRLDVLRCIAVLLVLFRHSGINFSVARAGWAGVDLFFVLSGFLISGLLFDEFKEHGQIDFKRFFIRRGFKIYPAFYVLLLATFVVEHSKFARTQHSASHFFSEFFYVQNYFGGLWPHTWSLGVEEHFYILLPVVLLLLIRWSTAHDNPFRFIPVAFGLVGMVCLVLRLLTILVAGPATPEELLLHRVFVPTHERIDALFFGVLLGYVHHFHPQLFTTLLRRKRSVFSFILLSAALLFPALVLPQGDPFMLTLGLTMLYLGFGTVLVLCLYTPGLLPAPLAKFCAPLGAGFAFLGMYSYSVYLWHGAVLSWGLALLQRHLHVNVTGSVFYLLYFLVSLAVGISMSRLIEYPMLRVRDRLFPSMASPRPSSTFQTSLAMDQKATAI